MIRAFPMHPFIIPTVAILVHELYYALKRLCTKLGMIKRCMQMFYIYR